MVISKIKSLLSWKKQSKRIANKISFLKIEKAGVTNDNIPFIKLYDGPKFYGIFPSQKQINLYLSLPLKIRNKLPEKCIRVAMDIIIRYVERGLKSGGPRKEEFYKVKKGDVVVEMGAYIGYYCMYLSEMVGNSGLVVAIEPLLDNLVLLRRNVMQNKLNNVKIITKGVWKEQKNLIFYRRKGDAQSASLQLKFYDSEKIEIEVDSLDSILKGINVMHVDFMIIQLNGVEIEALEGLNEIKPKNLAIAARYKRGKKSSSKIISELLGKRGYTIKIIDGDFVYAKYKNK